jgi:uracil DNA glycosylase
MEGSAAGEDAADAESSTVLGQALHRHLSSPAFRRLAKFVAKSARRAHNLSSGEDTFSALNVTPLDKVRVVIVGQDPYHGPGRLTGFAFLFYPDKLFHRHSEHLQELRS